MVHDVNIIFLGKIQSKNSYFLVGIAHLNINERTKLEHLSGKHQINSKKKSMTMMSSLPNEWLALELIIVANIKQKCSNSGQPPNQRENILLDLYATVQL